MSRSWDRSEGANKRLRVRSRDLEARPLSVGRSQPVFLHEGPQLDPPQHGVQLRLAP